MGVTKEIAAQSDSWASLPAMFLAQAARLGDRPFLWAKREGAYRARSWADIAGEVRALSRGLRRLGVRPGDRVVIVSENRPEWLIADLAVMAVRAISVPAYVTNTAADHRHILTDCGATAVILSSAALAERFLPVARDCGVRFAVAMEALPAGIRGPAMHGWPDVVTSEPAGMDDFDAMVTSIDRGDIACLIYTSGTSGAPKGVMLSHGSILADCEGAWRRMQEVHPKDEVFLSFLPLSHAYEHSCGQFLPIMMGAEIYYAESPQRLPANLLEVRPTMMVGVPRLFELSYRRITSEIDRLGGGRRWLVGQALSHGRRARERRGRRGPVERLANRLLDRLVRRQFRARFGGRLKFMVSGGAALRPEICRFFDALGISILQGYGLTEASPVVSCNPVREMKADTVGPPFDGVQVRIAEDGEVLVRGPVLMKGYWGNEPATRRALAGGWLHTGDIGSLDEDGYLRIAERKDDVIVLSSGDNVSPQSVEGALTLQPEIAQAMVFGDGRPHLVALLVPEQDYLRSWALARDLPPHLAELSGRADLVGDMMQAVERANAELSVVARVRRCAIANEPFTMENAQLTPTLKIRRHKVLAVYGAALEGLYGDAARSRGGGKRSRAVS